MYGYEYETDILLLLRLAEFLHRQDPGALQDILRMYPEFYLDMIFEFAECMIWNICKDANFEEDMDTGESSAVFSHPIIDRFCTLSSEWCCIWKEPSGAWRRKLTDIAEYYLLGTNHSVYEMTCRGNGHFVKIWTRFSIDCYESLDFGNSLVDMLLCVQRENERLETLLKNLEPGKEAA